MSKKTETIVDLTEWRAKVGRPTAKLHAGAVDFWVLTADKAEVIDICEDLVQYMESKYPQVLST